MNLTNNYFVQFMTIFAYFFHSLVLPIPAVVVPIGLDRNFVTHDEL